MRRYLKKHLPDPESISSNRYLRCFGDALIHPRLWHLNRHSVAGGISAGLFCGLIPGPFQMFFAAVCAVTLRVNLPLAMLTTLYTNPFTLVPIYLLAYQLGRLITGEGTGFTEPPEFDWQHAGQTLGALIDWMISLGQPLAVGLLALACLLASVGYFLVRAAWRAHLIHRWRQRRVQRVRRGRQS